MTAETPPTTTKNNQKSHGSSRRKPSSQPPFSLASGNDSTVDDVLEGVADLLKDKKNIVVLVGAGISTSVGIPDFRSKDKGLYNTLDAHALGLSCPEDLFCIEFFRDNPVPFYKFATNLYYPNQTNNSQSSASATKNGPKASSRTSKRRKPNGHSSLSAADTNGGMAQPSDSHKLLALLEQRKKLLRVYTQNIDGLESTAGVSDSKIVYCHGSLKFMLCTRCSKRRVPLDESILGAIRFGSVPRCRVVTSKSTALANSGRSPTRTSTRTKRPRSLMTSITDYEDDGMMCGGVLRPGITFFGETLDQSVSRKIESDQTKADALIVIGTSLSVAPISKVIEYLPRGIPRILVNRNIVHPKTHEDDEIETNFRKNYVFDAYLLGFCDDVTRALGKQLGLGFDIATKNNITERANNTKNATSKKRVPPGKEPPRNHKHASATGAKLLTSLLRSETESLSSPPSSTESTHSNEWSSVAVPKDRVILFPGALPSAAPTSEEPQEVYHEVAHCDGCSQEIPQGKPIYKCAKCFDFDLCHKCFPKVSKVHCNGTHTFRKEQ